MEIENADYIRHMISMVTSLIDNEIVMKVDCGIFIYVIFKVKTTTSKLTTQKKAKKSKIKQQ